jgi:hypothetical protein
VLDDSSLFLFRDFQRTHLDENSTQPQLPTEALWRRVGTLRRPGWLETSFLAETQYGQWTFRRGGCFGGSAQIIDSVSKQQIATFKSLWGTGGGTLTFADGQTFELAQEGWWRPVLSVIGADGQPVLRFHAREKTVEVASPASSGFANSAASLPDGRLTLLAMFTFYRVMQAEEDAAAAVLIAAT